MSEIDQPTEPNQEPVPEVLTHGPDDLVVALAGFDGPIDLLLSLAREQKVDLSTLSILQLAEQYLDYINNARKLRLELAADYLVMAAWLAYLKSRLLLPEEETQDENAADMAEALKFQLLRLEAMQKAAKSIFELPQLGSDTFMRGVPEKLEVIEKPVYHLPIYDLLSALGAPLRRRKHETYDIKPNRLYTLEESLTRMRRMLGGFMDWGNLQLFIPSLLGHDALESRSAIASTFAAALEMVKEGQLEIRQSQCFSAIYLRNKPKPSTSSDDTAPSGQ
ncbi:MAG: ScpA family protein [Alphaproteobacteria bacterium]|jgi:segregation and condensation protein A|nr:ScpA family protein [Alphaproteobacteria bacterium]